MIPSDYVVSALATLMWNESHEDLLLGMKVCGLVVRNRMLAGWENGQWLKLIEKHDFWRFDNKPPRVMTYGDPHNNQMFRRCLAAAENIYNGKEMDITADIFGAGSLWYCRLNDCSDEFKEKIVHDLGNHPMIATIGRNSCFR